MTFRLAALCLAVGCLPGCTSAIAPGAVAYPCDPQAASVATVCPEGMVCRQDGRCHRLDEAAAFPCEDDGHCHPSSRCGLNHTCHLRGAPAAYLCQSNADCEASWHCGVARTCYPRDDGGAALPCRDDRDCTVGWRCGLNALCHDRAVAADYPCALDGDCEGGFRCAFSGVCTQAPDERRVEDASDAGEAKRESPVRLEPPDTLSNVWPHLNSSGEYAVARGYGATWEYLVTSSSSGAFLSQTLPEPLLGTALMGTTAFAVTDGGFYAWSLPSGSAVRALPVGGEQLHPLDQSTSFLGPDPMRLLVAHRQALSLVTYASSSASALDASIPGASFVFAVRTLPGGSGGQPACAVASTPEGLFTASAPDAGASLEWQRAPFFEGTCAPPEFAQARPRRLRTTRVRGSEDVLVAELVLDGGTYLAAWIGRHDGGTPSCGAVGGCARLFPAARELGPCLACPPGSRLADFEPWVDGGVHVTVRCERPLADGGTRVERARLASLGSGCLGLSLSSADPFSDWLVAGESFGNFSPQDQMLAVAGGLGRLHAFDRRTYRARPYVLNALLLQTPLGLDHDAGFGVSAYDPFQGPFVTAWRPLPGAGLAPGPDPLSSTQRVVAVPRGAPGWVVRQLPSLSAFWVLDEARAGNPVVTTLRTSEAEQLGAKVQAELFQTADAGALLVVSINDLFYSSSQGADGGFALEPRASPAPLIPVEAFVRDDALPPSLFLRLWALAAGDLYKIDAETPRRWRTSFQVRPAGTLVALLAASTQARLGYEDGRLYSLPSLLRLAPPLAGGPVGSFAQACGQSWALAEEGLYRLEAVPSQDEGRWRPHPLDAVLPGVTFRGARLFTDPAGLVLSHPAGPLVRVRCQR